MLYCKLQIVYNDHGNHRHVWFHKWNDSSSIIKELSWLDQV